MSPHPAPARRSYCPNSFPFVQTFHLLTTSLFSPEKNRSCLGPFSLHHIPPTFLETAPAPLHSLPCPSPSVPITPDQYSALRRPSLGSWILDPFISCGIIPLSSHANDTFTSPWLQPPRESLRQCSYPSTTPRPPRSVRPFCMVPETCAWLVPLLFLEPVGLRWR